MQRAGIAKGHTGHYHVKANEIFGCFFFACPHDLKMLAYGVVRKLRVQNWTDASCRLKATGEGDEHTTAYPLRNIQPQDSLEEYKQELGFA
jgi:hypothetical protein